MRWEYAWATGRIDAPDDFQQHLNALGHAGWEAVGVTPRPGAHDDVTVLLKRKFRPGRAAGPLDRVFP
jgi:hypothetical protein